MTAAVLADFGSTFTKVTLVELGSGRLIGSGQSPTTVDSDVMRGFHAALREARSHADEPVELGPKRAASSAAGGLRVAAVGLVEDLTAAAARQVALNAGAIDTHTVVACNREIAAAVSHELGEGGRRVEVVANVMPQIGELNVEPARAAISEAFVRHVIRGKGLTTAPEFYRDVIMPTPEAVLQATRLVAEAAGGVAVVDIGGATTDVHSATRELTGTPGVEGPLLPTLPVLRTVQGDLGLRSNAISVLDTDREWLVQRLDEATLREATERRCEEPGLIAASRAEWNLDEALATSCSYHALRRHCGRLSVISGPGQAARIRTDGPDLREVRLLIGTGGILVR
ncbi:MAG TPA: glutamate mutase L, partial [Solirubrobacteraceae bacterium]